MDRTLVAEFPWLAVKSDLGDPAKWEGNPNTDTRTLGTSGVAFVQEMKLDLSGYVQSDLTLGFRRSFEQVSGGNSIFWDPTFVPGNDAIIQQTIISSVPFNDDQLIAALFSSPGFTQYDLAALDWGNFNRTHIIHGRYQIMQPNSTIGSDAFNNKGNATLMNLIDNYYSSLEPTAADCLYCYRIFSLPTPAGALGGVNQISLPAKRVILDAFTVEEPDLEYMMRLKRSYELANQV